MENKEQYFIPAKKRYSALPIEHQDLEDFYLKLRSVAFWVETEIPYSDDLKDWEKLSDGERHFIKQVLGFFSSSDIIVNDNLAINTLQEVPYFEASQFYEMQLMNEGIHSRTYAKLIEVLVKDEKEKKHLFEAMDTIPSVAKKAKWAEKWITQGDIVDKLIAFAIVEGLLFSGSFCAIYYMNSQQKMPALSMANKFIMRDECYIAGTEVLTKQGWVDMREIKIRDEVIGYKEGIGVVEEVTRIINRSYSGQMIQLENNFSKAVVTPNHDMLVFNKRDKKFDKVKASKLDLSSDNLFIPKTYVLDLQGDYHESPNSQEIADFYSVKDFKKSIIEYEGTVHCLTVPSGALITRYEGKTFIAGNCLHKDFAVHLYNNYVLKNKKKSNEYIKEIINEALAVEQEFVTESIPVSLIGMNSDLMIQYLRFVANSLYLELTNDTTPLYTDKNPFSFMESIALTNKTNFFERRVGEYKTAEMGDIELTEDF